MTEQESTSSLPERVECGPATDPVVRMIIATVVCVGFGLYCGYDAFIAKKYDVQEDAFNFWFNAGGFFLLVPVSLVLLGLTIRMVRRKLVADADGIGYAGSPGIAWPKVTKLVIRDKGLMDVCYEADDGEDVLKLDSWKLKNFDELVGLIEAKTEGIPVERAKKE